MTDQGCTYTSAIAFTQNIVVTQADKKADKKTGACVLREEEKLEQCMASKLLGLPRHLSSHGFGENTGFRLQERSEKVRLIKHSLKNLHPWI